MPCRFAASGAVTAQPMCVSSATVATGSLIFVIRPLRTGSRHLPTGIANPQQFSPLARLTWHPDPGYANMAPMSSEETWKQLRDRTRITRVSLSALRSQPEPGSADVGLVADDLEKVIAAIDCVLAGGSSDGGGPVTAP